MNRIQFYGSKFVEPIAQFLAAVRVPMRVRGSRAQLGTSLASVAELAEKHFAGELRGHICESTLVSALDALEGEPALILETGSSAWGTNSSIFFDGYVNIFGGSFWTVDNRPLPMFTLGKLMSPASLAICDDSVRFLSSWVTSHPNSRATLVYLDSWDLDLRDPLAAAIHGLREFFAIQPALASGSVLVVDDTPRNCDYFEGEMRELAEAWHHETGLVPGKGTLIVKLLESDPRYIKIAHEYQVVFRYEGE